jgi:hypothetical protein
MAIPFRWDIGHRAGLGRLLHGEASQVYPGFLGDLRRCAARIVAGSNNSNLVFIGRSPESAYDYLSGMLAETSWACRLKHLNVSMRGDSIAEIRSTYPAAVYALREYLSTLELTPQDVATAERGLTLVDLVASGETMRLTLQFIRLWARECRIDESAVLRRLRILGITSEYKPSPSTYRWQQHAKWTGQLSPGQIRNISIPWRLWDFLGNKQSKLTPSFHPAFWNSALVSSPTRSEESLKALRFARALFTRACTGKERELFISELVKPRHLKHPWLRSLIAELRNYTREVRAR